MASLNQIVDSVADGMNRSFDFAFKERLKFTVKYHRASLIRQSVERDGLSGETLQSTLVCLEKVDKIDSCSLEIGCSILKSKYKVPRPIRLKGIRSFLYVGDAAGTNPYGYCALEELPYKTKLKYTGHRPMYNYMNGYLYIYNNTKLKYARLTGLFSDPELLNTCACDETGKEVSCYNDDDNFPLDDDMIGFIVRGLMNGELRMVNKTDYEVEIDKEQNDRD